MGDSALISEYLLKHQVEFSIGNGKPKKEVEDYIFTEYRINKVCLGRIMNKFKRGPRGCQIRYYKITEPILDDQDETVVESIIDEPSVPINQTETVEQEVEKSIEESVEEQFENPTIQLPEGVENPHSIEISMYSKFAKKHVKADWRSRQIANLVLRTEYFNRFRNRIAEKYGSFTQFNDETIKETDKLMNEFVFKPESLKSYPNWNYENFVGKYFIQLGIPINSFLSDEYVKQMEIIRVKCHTDNARIIGEENFISDKLLELRDIALDKQLKKIGFSVDDPFFRHEFLYSQCTCLHWIYRNLSRIASQDNYDSTIYLNCPYKKTIKNLFYKKVRIGVNENGIQIYRTVFDFRLLWNYINSGI